MFVRRKILTISLAASLMAGLLFVSGCGDFLQTEPPGQLSEATYWQTEEDVRIATNDLYNHLYGLIRFDLSALSDEAIPNWSFDNLSTFARGQQTSETQFGNSWWPSWWEANYNGIRAANEVLARAPKVDQGDQETINDHMAEARFMRAYLYLYQVFLFGDVPLITEPISLEEANNVTRASQDSVWRFISNELQTAAQELPTNWTGENLGRATKGAAWGMRARAALYAASRNERLGNSQAASRYYEQARRSAQEVIALGEYDLHPSYEELFTPEAEYNDEVILNKDFVKNTHSNQVNEFIAPASLVSGRGQNFNVPTADLVDAYEMENGLPIDAAGSGYDPQNPYENRDPRLDYSVFVTGDQLPNGTTYDSRPGFDGPDDVEQGIATTNTGFNVEKYITDECLDNQYNCGVNIIEMRYAEILLIYAEAQYKITGSATSTAGPGSMSAKDALDEVRGRVGMPEVPADGGSNRTFMERIQHERLVELAFEGQRFFDVRRWGMAEDVLNGPVFGLRYEGQEGNMQQVRFAPYQRSFESHHYLWPIPQKETELVGLEQNPQY
jgi:hypothetical protein